MRYIGIIKLNFMSPLRRGLSFTMALLDAIPCLKFGYTADFNSNSTVVTAGHPIYNFFDKLLLYAMWLLRNCQANISQ